MGFVEILGLIFSGIGAIASLITIWDKILEWADESLFPWIEKNLPQIEETVREAFWQIDKIASPLRRSVKQAWRNLRRYLLDMALEFDRNQEKQWVKKVTTYIVRLLDSSEFEKTEVVKTVTEEIVPSDMLPPDVKEQFIKLKNSRYDINVTRVRDQEIEEITIIE